MFQDDTSISDLYPCMFHVSVGVYQDLHVKRLIDLVKVRFEDNLKIYLAHTNRRYLEVTNEMPVMKWEISNSKAEEILEATAQMCVRSYISPLYSRY